MRQHFNLGVSSQEVGANDDVKGVSVQHCAVLRHRFVARKKKHVGTPERMDGSPIPYSYGHSLSLLESLGFLGPFPSPHSGVGLAPLPSCLLRNFFMWESFSLSRASLTSWSTR